MSSLSDNDSLRACRPIIVAAPPARLLSTRHGERNKKLGSVAEFFNSLTWFWARGTALL